VGGCAEARPLQHEKCPRTLVPKGVDHESKGNPLASTIRKL